MRCTCMWSVVAVCTLPTLAGAQVEIFETGWVETAVLENIEAPETVRIHPLDGSIVYLTRSVDGLYRLTIDDPTPQLLSVYDRPFGILVDPSDGDIFVSEPVGGMVHRYDWTGGTSAGWLTQLLDGDDDPHGMAIAPADYTGPLVAPGEAMLVDVGNGGGEDAAWSWLLDTPDSEVRVVDDAGPLESAFDVAFSSDRCWVADDAVLHEFTNGGVQTLSLQASVILSVISLPNSDDIMIYDPSDGRVYRVSNGVDTLFLDLQGAPGGNSPLGFSQDGRMFAVADEQRDRIHIFERCPGDTNADGMVNFEDLNEVLDNWNLSVPPGSNGDVDGSGTVDFDDLNSVLDEWGSSC